MAKYIVTGYRRGYRKGTRICEWKPVSVHLIDASGPDRAVRIVADFIEESMDPEDGYKPVAYDVMAHSYVWDGTDGLYIKRADETRLGYVLKEQM